MEAVKFRNELKYVCSEQELVLIESRIKKLCRLDTHVGDSKTYLVRSVYFDDYDNHCFRDNENGTDPREKYRIRIYNGDTARIILECKRKEKGKNYKESCPLTVLQCQSILAGKFILKNIETDKLAEKEIRLLRKFYLQCTLNVFKPKVIVEYERTPYVYKTGNVRITFDRNISGSFKVNGFLQEKIVKRPVMSTGYHVLEVKYDELLPDCIYNAIQINNLIQTNFSKYYICRKNNFI